MKTIHQIFESKVFTINAGSGTHIIDDFDGAGRKGNFFSCFQGIDQLEFIGQGLTSQNMRLTQNGDDLEITFDGVANTKVVLQNISLEELENYSYGIGNIKFDGDSTIQNSFDVFNAHSNRRRVFRCDTVTFLNDLDNNIRGFNNSDDVINAQGGDDTLRGLSGDDILRGEDGNDFIFDEAGKDLIDGGLGVDTVSFESSPSSAFLFLGAQMVFNDGYGNQERIIDIENVIGSEFNDAIGGSDGDNVLDGNQGDDLIVGRMGADTLLGGSGFDQFDYNNPSEGGDTILDFQSDELFRVIDQGFGDGLSAGLLLEEQFVLGTEALNSYQRFIYDNTTGNLFFDVDGNGVAAQQHIALLVGAPEISASSIFVGSAPPVA